ncbi:MAG: TfoX/Sxy family protein [Dehalococcoidia bacterium]
MADEGIRDQLLSALAPLGVRSRAMFGGHGLFLAEKFFGIITDGKVYFRTDEESRAEYLARGMPPLESRTRPRGPKTVDRNFQVPPDIVSDPELLLAWALRAAES